MPALNQLQNVGAAVTPVGCDDGHYGIKICAGPDTFFQMPSRSNPGRLAAAHMGTSPKEGELDIVYETADGEFVTITAHDALLPAVDTRSSDYPTSSANRALVAHGLQSIGFRGHQPIALVSGLPINRFYSGAARNDDLIEAKRQSLLRPVLNGSDRERSVLVASHKVISEAVAAYYDALLDFDGCFNEEFKELADEDPVAVVDAGGKTLDIAAVKERGTGLYSELSGTADTGALFLYDDVGAEIAQRFNLKDEVPFSRISRAINTNVYTLYGAKHDVSDIVNKHLDAFADRIAFEVQKFLGDGSRFGKVLFVGGGANLLRSRLGRVFPGFPPEAISVSEQTDDPRFSSTFANARGMYKAAVLDMPNKG